MSQYTYLDLGYVWWLAHGYIDYGSVPTREIKQNAPGDELARDDNRLLGIIERFVNNGYEQKGIKIMITPHPP